MTAISCKSKVANLLMLSILSLFVCSVFAAEKESNLKKVKILVYTKNGKGYIHDNIAEAVKGVQKLGADNGFKVDVSDDPAVYTEENLKQYTMLLFTSTNNDVFDTDAQRLAFRRYIEAGGGFVGVHSVTGTERNWVWFKQMIGGTFSWHAKNQKFKVKVIDPDHETVKGLPMVWEREFGDECYFTKELYPGIKVTMAHDLSSLDERDQDKIAQFSAPFKDLYPAVWYQNFDGGNVWITTLGHNKEYYQQPLYLQHLLQGIKFVAGESKKLDYSKAYASSRDTPVQY
ncbi:ThuA domain-containing protein [Daejeonella sp.]|uniref:ThuA domain-containing protein n=1 Tax=Daejeonella sp. TaxID=2805397 RepID=UPI003983158E